MLRLVARLLLRIFFNYSIHGPIPKSPPSKLLILCNHQSFVDPLFILAYCPFDIWWITHTQIAAQWRFRIFLRFVPHLVVDTANPLTMKLVIEHINSGKPVCIFPEGRLTVTGALMKVYDGLAFLQFKTGAQLLPVSVDGAVYSRFNRLKKPFPRLLRPRVRATFFPLTTLPEPSGSSARQRRRNASHQIRRLLEQTWFESQFQHVTNLFDAFLNAISIYGRGAESLSDIRFTPDSYGGVLRGALALGRLVSRHTAEREIAGVLMPNASPTIMLILGMFAQRRIPAMLNYTAGVEGMQSACQTAKIKTIFTSRTFLEKAKLTEKVAQLRDLRILYLEDLRPQFTIADKAWLILYALRFPRAVIQDPKPDDPALVLFTSGSEGKPKGVVLSHRNILANIAQVRSVIEFSNQDKFLAALPLFHSFGLTVGALVPLTTGARVFLYPSPLHYRMIPEIAYDQDCTVIFGTGTFLARYAKMAHEYDFYSAHHVLSGAEKLPDAVRQVWLEKFGIRVLEGYGITEMSPAVSVNTPYFNRPGTVGKILPGIEYDVTPVEGIDHGGMLHLRGPTRMLGYLLHDKPGVIQEPQSPKGPGWYETGDIVEIDADGFLKIAGRVKRFAKVAGEMVSLEVVEQLAALRSPSRAHAASTYASSRRGEVIVLFTEDRELRREHLSAAARERGSPEIAVPRHIQYIEKIPRLGSGKFDYVKLKEMAGGLSTEEKLASQDARS